MKTTELFAELLIIGFGALVWLALLVSIVLGTEIVSAAFDSEVISPAVFILFSISSAYVLGIIVDRAYLPIWRNVENHLMKSNGVELSAYYDYQIKLAMKGTDELVTFMDYYASRLRILT